MKIQRLALSAIIACFGAHAHSADLPSSKLTAMTNCAGLKLTNVMTGQLGDYEFSQGLGKSTRSGFINRKAGRVAQTCILPSVNAGEIIYAEVDTKEFQAMGSQWEFQCVKSDNLDYGLVNEKEPRSEFPNRITYLSGKDLMLHCGHNVSGVKECAKGSNSTRSGEWDKHLTSKGKTMISVFASRSTLSPKAGEKLYCQYFNKKTNTSLFAFEYLRTP